MGLDWREEARADLDRMRAVADPGGSIATLFDHLERPRPRAAPAGAIEAAARRMTAAHARCDTLAAPAAAGGALGLIACSPEPACHALTLVRSNAMPIGATSTVTHGRVAVSAGPSTGTAAAIRSQADAVAS